MTQPPPPIHQPRSPRARMKIAGIGCGGLVGLILLLAVIGTIIGPPKKTNTAAASTITVQASDTVAASASPSPSTDPSTAAVTPPSPAPTTSEPAQPTVIHLAHGAQHGLTNCVITYKDAQNGAGTSTFTAIVLDSSGKPYSPTGANPYSIMLQMNLTDTARTAYPVSEALGNGSRTAADNGGSDWFTTNQGDVQVSANGTQGAVAATVTVPLAQVKSVEGNIMITSQNDNNYLKQTECAVRPDQG